MTKQCNLKGRQQEYLLHLGQARSCCRSYSVDLEQFDSETSLQQHWDLESQQLSQGIEIASCEICWQKESQQQLSFRQTHGNTQQFSVDLFMSNACNQACSYCSPRYSTEWQRKVEQHKFINISRSLSQSLEPIKTKDSNHWLPRIKSLLDQCADNSVELRLLGGEPLMQLNSLKVLETFDWRKIKTLGITTNLNPPSTKYLEWLLASIPHELLQFTVSLDATPDLNHVARAGFNSARFNEHLDILLEHGIKPKIHTVISALNWFDLANFEQWINSNQFDVMYSPVNNPSCLSSALVPVALRQKVFEHVKSKDPVLIQCLNEQQVAVDILLFEQYNYIKQYFFINNINPRSVDNSLFTQWWNDLDQTYGQ